MNGPGFELSDAVRLRQLEDGDADELYALVDANRAYLAPWMPWAEGQTRAGTLEFIRTSRRQLEAENGFQVGLTVDERLAGTLGYHSVDRHDLRANIGYWLAQERQGQGLMTGAVRALVDYAFEEWGLHRVEIRTAVENSRSRALCERLGFVEEGVLREVERIGDRYNDLVVYAMLEPQWKTPTALR